MIDENRNSNSCCAICRCPWEMKETTDANGNKKKHLVRLCELERDEIPDEWFRFKINNCPFVEL